MKEDDQEDKNIIIGNIFNFCVFVSVFIFLFSYKTTLLFTELTPAQENTLKYLQGKEELKIEYTRQELSHLQDVQRVMKGVNYAFYGSLVLWLVTIGINLADKRRWLVPKLFWYGGITTVVMVIFILLFIFFFFDFSFIIFHKFFFPLGNWQFSADSLLIQTFPQEFFVKIGRIIFLQALFLGSLFILLSFYFQKWHTSKELKPS